MKSQRSLPFSFVLIFMLTFFFHFSMTAQVNCDSLNYVVELVDPNGNYLVEYGDEIELQVLTNFPTFLIAEIEWSSEQPLACNDCLTNYFSPTDTTTVQVLVTLNDGCQFNDEVTINVVLYKNVYIPSAFSPNDDGVNDYFRVYGYQKSVKQIKSLRIFSRKGHLLYVAYNFPPNDFSFGWDGRHRGEKLNAEVYVWKSVIEYVNGEEETRTGTFSLIR